MESGPHRGEKDKRREDGKGAKERSPERSGKKNTPLPCPQCDLWLRPQTMATASTSSLRGHLGNLTKLDNFLKDVLTLLRSGFLKRCLKAQWQTLPRYLLLTVPAAWPRDSDI